MDEKHPTKPGSDSKGRFVKGNTMAKQGHGVKLNGLYKPELSIVNVTPSFFCPNCAHIGQLAHATKHYSKCNTKLPQDVIDAKYIEYKQSPRWDRSIHRNTGLDPMKILTKDELLAALSEIVIERYEPAINTAINNLSKHHKLGEDTKPTGADVFGGFLFKLAEPPKPEEETPEDKEEK